MKCGSAKIGRNALASAGKINVTQFGATLIADVKTSIAASSNITVDERVKSIM